MNKIARKPSSDPVQEKLRESKSQWNKSVSEFIKNLIDLKKTMNGWPSKFHMERSFIKDPIPSDPHSILGVLASDFQELANSGNNIIQQQIEYAKNRKQKQQKGTPNSNLSQQLLSASIEYELIAEGSNPITRFFSRLKGPWLGDSPEARARKYRLAMLRACSLLEKDLKKFEAQILGSSGESIFIAGKMLYQIDNHLKFVLESLNGFKAMEKTDNYNAPNEPELNINSNEIDTANKSITDFRKNYANFTDLDGALVKQFSTLILKFLSDDSVKEQLAPEINSIYQLILTDINNKHKTTSDNLGDVLIKSKTASLEIVAQNILDKWVGKINHKINPFDKTSPLRLDVSKQASEVITLINQLMNSLEQGLVTEQVKSLLNEINNKMIIIKSLMRPLEATIRNKLFDKTFVDLLQDNKLTDYDSSLNKKQKEHLERMVQNKQFRDLTNIYSRT